MSGHSVIDLFAGAGGWDEGLRQLGITDVLGIDNDEQACLAAEAAGHERVRRDLGAMTPMVHTPGSGLDGLIASPPCPAFSLAGKRLGAADVRRELTCVPMAWALALRPRWVAFEQVPGVLPIWQAAAAELEAAGYSAWAGYLNAAAYSVPQRRKRAVLLARRDGVAVRAPLPAGREVTMADALGWGMTARPYFTLAAARTSGGGPDKEKVGGSGAREALYAERDAGRWIEPAVPEHDGAIRVRLEEAGVLMGFRRDYPWQGPMSKRYQQLSNAVPPPLAAAVLEQFVTAAQAVA